jgi:periplasmic divalent cation tolerance protein
VAGTAREAMIEEDLSAMKAVIVLTTVAQTYDGREIAEEIVSRRLASCVNIIPQVYSVYRWQDKVEHDNEQILLIKTLEERLDELRDFIFKRHPYDVPEFVVIDIDRIEGPYRDWLVRAAMIEERDV